MLFVVWFNPYCSLHASKPLLLQEIDKAIRNGDGGYLATCQAPQEPILQFNWQAQAVPGLCNYALVEFPVLKAYLFLKPIPKKTIKAGH